MGRSPHFDMPISVEPASVPSTRSRRSHVDSEQHRTSLGLSLAGLLIAFLPVLISYLGTLWKRDFYQFFPFALFATFGLALFRGGDPASFSDRGRHWIRSAAVVLVSALVLLVGLIYASPWPCFVAFLGMTLALLSCWPDAARRSSLAYLILPSLLLIRPPLNLDVQLIQSLQPLTTRCASAVLYGLGIDHIRLGNVLQPFHGQPLFVEEACSGVQSLFTMMFIAAFIGVFRRYTTFRTLVLMLVSVFWALAMNVGRVVTIAVAQTRLDLDLTHGWPHEVVGYTGMLLATILLINSDVLLTFFLAGVPDSVPQLMVNPFVSAWNALFVIAARSESRSLKTRQFSGPAPRLLSILIAGGCFLATLPAYGLFFRGIGPSDSADTLSASRITSDWLPVADFAGCSLVRFETETRDALSEFGQFSHRWILSEPSGDVMHSLDHPFFGWHDLTVCYRNIGWRMESVRELRDQHTGADWPVTFAEFVKPTGERALLCFSSFSMRGDPIQPHVTNVLAAIRNRLQNAAQDAVPCIQFQSLAYTTTQASADRISQLLQSHIRSRTAVVSSLQSSGTASNAVSDSQTATSEATTP